jgi:hypothetical protein
MPAARKRDHKPVSAPKFKRSFLSCALESRRGVLGGLSEKEIAPSKRGLKSREETPHEGAWKP